MVRTMVTPDSANIELSIPESYVGKKIEVLIYAIEEVENSINEPIARLVSPKKPSDFKGAIPADAVDEFQNYVKKSREEWQQRIS